MASLKTTADISELVSGWLPEPSLVQTRYQFADDTYRVDLETCGGQAHIFISADPDAFRHEGLKQCVDAALHSIWSRGLATQVQAHGRSQ